MTQYRKTVCEISLGAIARNIRKMRSSLPRDVKLMLVVKADAYGHGIVSVSRLAHEESVDCLGVAIAEEGVTIREAGITTPVLIFGALNQDGMDAAARFDLIVTLPNCDGVDMAALAAQRAGKPIHGHLKLDTGMNRIGIREESELLLALERLEREPRVHLMGAFTHFADANNSDSRFTDHQIKRFRAFSKLLPSGLTLHAAATGGILFNPEAGFNMVRIGIGIYGYAPQNSHLGFEPCLTLSAEVAFVKTIGAGESVGYGCTYTAQQAMKIATLAIGYGDGYPRLMSNRGRVLIHGVSCPIVGLVCMDQLMVDVSAVDSVKQGDSAVLIGKQGDEFIGADEVAQICQTIPYEVLLSFSGRVPKIHIHTEEN